ncbi:MAG: hypothetical protein ACREO3_02540, partial [Arenimonas sp.]
MTRARLAAACALALALVVPSPAARADWKRDYSFGQQAYEKGNWAEAEKLMKSAMAEEPAASARKRMQGTRFEVYAPAHFAAVAAFKQGACGRALQYLDDGPTRAVVAQLSNLAAEAQQVRAGCGNNVATTPTEAPAPPVVTAPKPPVSTPIATVPDKPAPPPIEVPKPVVRPTETPVAPAPTPTATNTAAPAALRIAVRAFIAGDYASTLKVSDAGISDTRGRALVLLVRAAAGYTQAELRGGDAALSARAESDVRASRKLSRIDPDPSLFSPKVRA